MPEYQSRNEGFGSSAPSDPDIEPTPEQIDAWNNEAGTAPEADGLEHADVDSSAETESEPEPSAEQKEEPQTYKQKPEKKTPLQLHREKKEKSANSNELYKQIRLLSKEVRDLKAEKARRDQGLDTKPEDWENLAKEYERLGDWEAAQKARQQGEQAQVKQQQYQQSKWFEDTWHANEADIAEQDPRFFDPESTIGQRMQAIFNNPDLSRRYHQHPDGIWAAYHRAVAEEASELIPKLVQVLETLQSENERLKKGQRPLVSSPGRGSAAGPKALKDMGDDELEKLALQEAAMIDGRR